MTTPSRRGSTPASITVGPMTAWRSTAAPCWRGSRRRAAARRGRPWSCTLGCDAHDTNREEEYVTELQMRVE